MKNMKNMKNILNNYTYLSLFLALSLVITSCSWEDDDFGSDVSKVVPIISGVNGETVAFVGDTYTYTLSPYRGGSEYNWVITGADMSPVAGRPDQVDITFTQFAQPVSLSVNEIASNGSTSNVLTTNITVFGTPCNWTLNMQDAYGDGWNGASVTFTFEGTVLGTYALAGASGTETIPVPDGGDVTVSFSSGDWDEEITYQVLDSSGAEVFADGPTPVVGDAFIATNSCN